MLPISVCLISKNEEKNIERCLSLLKPYGFELVLVDTGSTDRTRELALPYADKILDFVWIDDFSAAKNYAVSQAKYDWILSVDCDEFLENLDLEDLLTFMESHSDHTGAVLIENTYHGQDGEGLYSVRLDRFFHRGFYRFSGPIHEYLTPIGNHLFQSLPVPITFLHGGYNISQEELQGKVDRNNRLLFKQLKEHPEDPYLYFQIGQSYNLIHDDAHALEYYQKGLSYDLDPSLPYVQMMVTAYGYALLHLGQLAEALNLENVYSSFADNPEFVFLMGLIYMRNSLPIKAMTEFIKVKTFRNCNSQGLTTYLSSYNIGFLFESMGDTKTAREHYLKCRDYQPAKERLELLDTKEKGST